MDKNDTAVKDHGRMIRDQTSAGVMMVVRSWQVSRKSH